MIAIVDYGVGNLFSLLSSLKALGLEAEVTGDAGRLRAADRIILPGVGAFGDARRKLDLCNERAGRQYGEDGYGDEYLVLLTADTVREMAFSEYTMIRSAEIMAEAAAGGKAVEA